MTSIKKKKLPRTVKLPDKSLEKWMKEVGATSMIVIADFEGFGLQANIHHVHPMRVPRYLKVLKDITDSLISQTLEILKRKIKSL